MSKLEALIHQLCPDGVKHTKLQNVCIFQNGFAFKSSLFKEQGEPILRIANISDSEIAEDSEYVFFNPDDYKEDLDRYRVFKGDIVVAMSGATTGKIGYNYSDKTYYLNQRVGMFVVNEKLMVKRYLYHWLCMQSSNILNAASGSGAQLNLSSTKMMEFLIPLPPLEVQFEIVQILDQFTELTAELTAELAARKKQYEYYRDQLLTADVTTQQVKLGKICSVITKGTTPKTYTKSGVSFVKTEAFDGTRIVPERLSYIDEETHNTALKRSILKENDILITIAGATIGKCAMVQKEILPANTNQALAIIRVADGNMPQYVMYLLQSDLMKQYIRKNIKGSAQPNLNLQQLNDFVIPLPPLEEQEHIVSALERFDTLCNDLTSGLPAEIEARRKQYEYYRDKLLTFKERGTE